MKKLSILLIALISFQLNGIAQLIRKSSTVNAAAQPAGMSMVAEGVYYIKIAETGKYLGVEGINKENGARLIQWDFANFPNHQFLIQRSPDGYYYIKAMHSNRYLNAAGQSTADGTPIIQWDFVEQDNLKWSFYFSKMNGSYTIRNKQSNKELKLNSAVNNPTNGVVLCINGNANAGTQGFVLQPVKPTEPASGLSANVRNNRNTVVASKYLVQSMDIRMKDGSIVRRTISPRERMSNNTASKRETIKFVDAAGCTTKVAKIDMDTKDFVPVTASRYLQYNAPGLIYDVRRFYSGDYANRHISTEGENREPIVLTTTVRNKVGPISLPIAIPTSTTINQAIKDLQDGYSTDPDLTANQSMIYHSSYVENNTELQMKIGASAHYMMASFDADMAIKNTKETKTFYIEAEKELFTLNVERPKQGFFTQPDPAHADMGYISSVSYGVKIIGKIEVVNSESSLGTNFKAMIEAGFAGGSVDLSSLSRESNKNVRCFFYVVGGTSEKVTGTNLAEVYGTVNEILRKVNYKTCMPIRVEFRHLTTNDPITFKDATNSFPYEVCTPKAIQEANKNFEFKIASLMAIGSDIEMYGDVWVELWSPRFGDLKRFRTSGNGLFALRQNVHLTKDDLARYALNLPTVTYKDIPAEFVRDAEVHVYFNLFDYNTVGGDNLLKQRGGVIYTIPTSPPQSYFRMVIPVRDFATENSKTYTTDFVDGDGVSIGLLLKQTLQIPAGK